MNRTTACVGLAAWMTMAGVAAAGDPLADGFRTPPPDAKPRTWWHWMNGNIAREGITADLEAMARIGLGGAHIFNVSYGEAPGPVTVLSAEWHALMQHAFAEADRLGLEITVHACPGWSESGGPWVAPNQAMQEITVSRTRAPGGGHVETKLPPPPSRCRHYRDLAVFAVPTDPGEPRPLPDLKPRLSGTLPAEELAKAVDGRSETAAIFPIPGTNAPCILQLDFDEPISFASARLRTATFPEYPWASELQVSDDGTTWRKIASFATQPSPMTSFAPVRAKHVRLLLTRAHYFLAQRLVIEDLELGGPRLPRFEQKAAWAPGRIADPRPGAAPATNSALRAIAADHVIDLYGRMDSSGRLVCDLPAGDWTILRIGYTPTGMINKPAPAAGTGLECDKLNAEAVSAFFDGMMGKLIRDAGPLAGRSLKQMLIDSWEANCQNWTPAMREEFTRLRGYDPFPWLPALAGCVIGSEDDTERFLWDFRRTIADLVAEHHYADPRARLNGHGMKLISEAVGINMPTVADQFQCKGRTDIPMGEFWLSGAQDVKEAAAAAHVYGKTIVGAESFTASKEQAGWRSDPFSLKSLGDHAFTLGLNQIVFHRYAHQPWPDRVPGMTMGPWGINFERTQTWWEPGAAWISYLSRCQYLLQQGLFAGDLLYYCGEGAPLDLPARDALVPPPPEGYDYDACSAEVLLTRATAHDGRIELPDGKSYALLVLPDNDRMTPAVARKVRELVASGACVLGRKPVRSPSRTGFPASDSEVRRIGDEVWGESAPAPAAPTPASPAPAAPATNKPPAKKGPAAKNPKAPAAKVVSRSFGSGRVFTSGSMAAILADLKVGRDFEFAGSTNAKVEWIHRSATNAEIYFVCNREARPEAGTAFFRTTGRAPEFWHPDTGLIEPATAWKQEGGRISVPLRLDPCGSVFVVFRTATGAADPIVSKPPDPAEAELTATDDGAPAVLAWKAGAWTATTAKGRTLRAACAALTAPAELAGPWTLAFPPRRGAPASVTLDRLISWTAHPDEGVKYFSGTATYTCTFERPDGGPDSAAGRRLFLDLGRVECLAEVLVNDRNLGVLWKPPFRIDITSAVQPGANKLEVRVTNLWPNRLIGDLRKPEAERITWTAWNPYTADDPLRDSGLLGPVVLRTAALVPLKP